MSTEATNPSSGAAEPVVVTYESLHGIEPAQEAQPEGQEAAQPTEVDASEEQHDGTNEGDSDTSAESSEKELSPVEKAKKGTPKGVQVKLDKLTREIHDRDRLLEQQQAFIDRLVKSDRADESFEPVQVDPSAKPDPKNFRSDMEYVEALAEWKFEQKFAAFQAKQAEQTTKSKLDAAEDIARAKYTDYDDAIAVFAQSKLAKNDAVLDVIQASSIGPELAYHIATTDGLDAELAKLPAYRVAAKLAQIEDQLLAPVEKSKPVSKAPPPVGQLKGGANPGAAYFDDNSPIISEAAVRAEVEATRKRYAAMGKRSPV